MNSNTVITDLLTKAYNNTITEYERCYLDLLLNKNKKNNCEEKELLRFLMEQSSIFREYEDLLVFDDEKPMISHLLFNSLI